MTQKRAVAATTQRVLMFNFVDSSSETSGVVMVVGIHITSPKDRTYVHHLIGLLSDGRVILDFVSEQSLAQVKLNQPANVRAGSHSGGMKHMLSVAIAVIGDPKLVFLDEPATGMDPITRRHVWDIIEEAKNGMDPVTRRHVWDIIEEAKKGRAIVLTTHSMEEADVLSVRIAIMAKGKLWCIGTSIRLKSKFGTRYIANVNLSGNGCTQSPNIQVVKWFFKEWIAMIALG
ncbi:hypothetical protein GUJ93_ZPchr0013g35370 [Zizania palustris]|uniref:ATPase AAA-type core domain-containing protein n=1 Tax=Zizania palustris TaxID=103762 RepID=A0A8J5XA70_ZIZPA|nr:hypothetical protein GUJ93_ZPchr0013g35370 [Zizania palustris]